MDRVHVVNFLAAMLTWLPAGDARERGRLALRRLIDVFIEVLPPWWFVARHLRRWAARSFAIRLYSRSRLAMRAAAQFGPRRDGSPSAEPDGQEREVRDVGVQVPEDIQPTSMEDLSIYMEPPGLGPLEPVAGPSTDHVLDLFITEEERRMFDV